MVLSKGINLQIIIKLSGTLSNKICRIQKKLNHLEDLKQQKTAYLQLYNQMITIYFINYKT
jgi:hypothetical protein